MQLRFNAQSSPSIDEKVKARLKTLAGRRMTKDGVIVIEAKRYRERERNREDARARLAALIERAATPAKTRKKTRVSVSQKVKRLEGKRRRSDLKQMRKRPIAD